jgi:uncharacterized membrane protein
VRNTSNARVAALMRWPVLIGLLIGIGTWIYLAPPGFMGKLDAIGYAVCHRLDSHSLHIGELQMPLCARCTGEFNAAALALVFQAMVSPRSSRLPSRGILAALAVLFLAFAVDGANSYLGLMRANQPGVQAAIPSIYQTTSLTRVLTGSGMGMALAAVLYPMYNQTVWQLPGEDRALDWRKFLVLSAGLVAVDLGIITESPVVLYPAAILSAAGVLALLSMVFSIVWIMLMGQENAFAGIRELWLPAAAGLTLALVMVLGIDLARFSVTRTWGGFPGLQG